MSNGVVVDFFPRGIQRSLKDENNTYVLVKPYSFEYPKQKPIPYYQTIDNRNKKAIYKVKK